MTYNAPKRSKPSVWLYGKRNTGHTAGIVRRKAAYLSEDRQPVVTSDMEETLLELAGDMMEEFLDFPFMRM